MDMNKDILITQLKENIYSMVSLANEAIDKSVIAFLNNDIDLANKIIQGDDLINQLETQIESKGLKCLALYQPEASDLRFVVGILRMVTDIERIGDLAVNIAESVKKTELDPKIPPNLDAISDITYMTKITICMVQDAINSVVSGNNDLAKSVLKQDDQVDDINRQIFRELLISMMEEPKKISSLIQYLLVSRNLERIGDHGKNIAESAIFIVKGKNVKHHLIEEDLE
jgi:phosphate transport system protein